MRINQSRIFILLAMLLAGILVFSGCAQTIGMAKGWAGGTVAGDTIFVGSMEGKLLALNISDGSRLGEPIRLEAEQPAGGLGCIPFGCATGSIAVAIYSSPAVDEDLVYVGGYDGKVRAFVFEEDRLRQEPKWDSRPKDISGSIVGGLVVDQSAVYYGTSGGKVYAVDVTDGHRKWVFETDDKIWSTPAIDGDTLFIGCFDKKLYAQSTTDGTKKWEFETEGAITSTPLVHDSRVYVGSFDMHFYAVDAVSGQQIWRFPSDEEEDGNKPDNWFWAKPLVHNDVVYAPCLDGKVYALDARNGRLIVAFDLGNPIVSSPVLVGDLVIVATTSLTKSIGAVYSLNTTNNHQSPLMDDLKEKIFAPLFASETTAYIHTNQDNLYAIDTQSGASKKFSLSGE